MTITKNGLLSSLGFSRFDEVGFKITGYQLNKMLIEYSLNFTSDYNGILESNGSNLIYSLEDTEDIINIDLGVEVLTFKVLDIVKNDTNTATISFNNSTDVSLGVGSLLLVLGVIGYNENDEVDYNCDLICEVLSTRKEAGVETILIKAYSYTGSDVALPTIKNKNKFFIYKLVK